MPFESNLPVGDEKFINWLREFRDSEQQVLWTHSFTNFNRFSKLILADFRIDANCINFLKMLISLNEN